MTEVSNLKKVAVSDDGLSILFERPAPIAKQLSDNVSSVARGALPPEADRIGSRPDGATLRGSVVVSGPEMLPAPTRSFGTVDWPGPLLIDGRAPIRVMVAATGNEKGIGEWCEALAAAMPQDAVEWLFAIWGDDTEECAPRLAPHGELLRLPEGDDDAWQQFRRAAFGFRPHVVHAHYHLGAQWGQLCGIPVVATVHSGEIEDALFYGAQYADVSARVAGNCDVADYTIEGPSEDYLSLYQAAVYPESDIVMICNGPAPLTRLACEKLFRCCNVPARVTLVDATDESLIDYLAPWLSQDNVQVAHEEGASMTDAWAGLISPRQWAFLLNDSTWIGERGLFPLLREGRRRGGDTVVMPSWGGAEPEGLEPGLFPLATLRHIREQKSLHRIPFFDSHRCDGVEWQSI